MNFFGWIHGMFGLSMLLLMGSPLYGGEEPEEKFEVRIARSDGSIILTKGGALLAVARIRPVSDDPVWKKNREWKKLTPLEQEKEVLRPITFSGQGVPKNKMEASAILRAHRMVDGVRVFVQPEYSATPTSSKFAAQTGLPENSQRLPLELAIELFPDPKGKGTLPQLSRKFATQSSKSGDSEEAADAPIHAMRLSFKGPGGWRTEIARSAPVTWSIKKTKHNILLTQRLLTNPAQPEKLAAFVFYLGRRWDVHRPELSPLRIQKRKTPAGEFIEGSLRVYAGGSDPYSFEDLSVFVEVAFPRKGTAKPKVVMLPCYFWEAPTGVFAEGEFRFRVAPPTSGVYGLRAVVIARTDTLYSDAVAVQAGPRVSPGFVRSESEKRHFRFDNGDVYLPVGINLGWPKKKGDASGYQERFRRLAKNGGNATRIWLSSWGMPLEGGRAGQFDPDVAASLDAIFLSAQARGIYIILVAENAYDLTRKSAQHPYFREQGGPLSATAEFFRNEEAIRFFKRRLTYLAARYGAYRSVLAWELLNEVDEAWHALKIDPDGRTTSAEEADRARLARREVLNWITLISSHLRAMDPHGHPISISVALNPTAPWKELETSNALQMVQAHGYLPRSIQAVDDLAFDGAGTIEAWAKAAREVGRSHRPYLLAEFGYFEPHDDVWLNQNAAQQVTERNSRDSEGILFHNGMMAGLATGMAGTPFFWWWDRYVERHDLWNRIKGPALFAQALSELATREGFETLRSLSNSEEKNASVRILGRVGNNGMCVWIQDRRSTWARKLERKEGTPSALIDLKLKLPALKPGHYEITWLDVWKGVQIKRDNLVVPMQKHNTTPKAIDLKCPKFVRDLAVIIAIKKKPQ